VTKVFYTDTELLEGLAAGNRDAVTALYKLYHAILTKWILSRGGLEADAEDVFQEALVVLFEKAKSPEFCLTCKLSTYLFAVSKRIWFRKMEQAGIYHPLAAEEDGDLDFAGGTYDSDLEQHMEKEKQYALLAKALDRLGAPCSALLKAFYEEKRNMQEIAELFRYTNAENAKTQKYKCLTRLRKLFFAAGVEIRH